MILAVNRTKAEDEIIAKYPLMVVESQNKISKAASELIAKIPDERARDSESMQLRLLTNKLIPTYESKLSPDLKKLFDTYHTNLRDIEGRKAKVIENQKPGETFDQTNQRLLDEEAKKQNEKQASIQNKFGETVTDVD